MLPRVAPFSSISRPIFTVIFPHKLKYQFFLHPSVHRRLFLTRRPTSLAAFGTSSFSTRSGLGREGRSGSSKSLIEDEAELSDWVSGLSSNSFKKTKMYSDSENETDNVRDSGSRGGERYGKRRRDSEFDNDVGLRRRGEGSSMTREAFSGSRRKSVDDSKASLGGKFGGRSGRNDGFLSRGYDERKEKSGRGRGSPDSDFSGRRGQGERTSRSRETFSDGYLGGRSGRDSGFQSSGNNERRQSGRGRDMQSRRARGRGSDFEMDRERKTIEKRGLLVSDEEDEDEVYEVEEEDMGYKSFRELIDSDEVDDDEDDEEVEVGDDVLVRNENFPLQNSRGGSDSYLSESRFDECSISSLTVKAIKDAGYEKMTLVQEATLPVILKGKDVMAKAKTGTGKTVAFLLPAIELVAKSPPIERDQKRPPILVLVVCPTRELATQAAKEAETLLKYHPSIGVQVVIGGTRLPLEQKRMQANPCQILVATPGRLRDHIENTPGFATRLMGVKVLVLDEADHLLDMGFRREIEKIVAAVPKQRQTLLFSATIPQEVRQICHIALKRDHEYINTVQEGSEDTHSQVQQMHIVAPLEKHFPLLYSLLKDHIADDVNYKILVFCTTAMVTKLVAQLLSELNLNVREIHSRKPQTYRTRVSDEFRKSKGLILVTSDVSARGVDYPDVTLVIQIGVPSDRQQYIHRLGRTGRKGKEGQGILLLAPWEEFFLSSTKDLPISKAPEPLVDPDTRKKVERALSHVEMKNKEAAYQAWLGYYNSNKNIGRDKYRLVELANEFSHSMGMDNPPAIPKLVLGKMGLKNIPGLRTK